MRTTLKLNQIIDEWIREIDVLPETQKDYRRKIGMWFRWLSAQGIDPRSPSRENLFEYKEFQQSKGHSSFTYLSYVGVVKLFYKYCEKRNYYQSIGEGIATSIKQRGHFKEPLSAEQAGRLLDSINTETISGKRDKLIISLMLTNGLRTCEVHRLNISDLDKQGEQMVMHIQRKGRVDKSDTLAVPQLVAELIEDYLSVRSFDMGDPLIVNHLKGVQSERLSKQTISHTVKRRLRAIGIDDPKISAHSLRHTCGCLLVASGMSVEMIKDLLGHSDSATTRIYVEQAQRRRLIESNPGNVISSIITKNTRKR